MNKNNNNTSKIVDGKISCDSSIKGKMLRTFNKVKDEINSSNVKLNTVLKKLKRAMPTLTHVSRHSCNTQ